MINNNSKEEENIMKKKLVSILLSLCLCCSVTACGNSGSVEKSDGNAVSESAEQTTEEKSKEELSVDKNLLSVEVTLPASLAGESGNTVLTDEAKSHGVKDITENPDGSITMKMSKSAHKELLDSIKISINESINEMLANEENCPSFESITYNDDVTVFEVKVDSATYNSIQSFSALSFYVMGNLYQAFNGVPEAELKTVVNFADKDTGEVLNSGDSTSMKEVAQE